MTQRAIEIRSLEGVSTSEAVEMMTGWSPFDLWRCEGESNSVRCCEMATLDLGNPPKAQLCDRCAAKPEFRRFRVREPLHHSDNLRREFAESRRRSLASTPHRVAPSPVIHDVARSGGT